MGQVAGTLDKVGVLQLARAVGALEDLGAIVAVTVGVPVPVTGARYLVRSGLVVGVTVRQRTISGWDISTFIFIILMLFLLLGIVAMSARRCYSVMDRSVGCAAVVRTSARVPTSGAI